MYRFCPIYNFWRPWARKTSQAGRVHSLYAWSYARQGYKGGPISRTRGMRRRVKLVFNSALWPAALVLSATRHTAEFGEPVKYRTGKGRLQQFGEQIRLGMLHSVPPRSYYWFRIFEDGNQARAEEFLHYHENNYILATAGRMDDQRKLLNKNDFAAWCRRLGIPTVPIVAHLRREEVLDGRVRSFELPRKSVFAKPARGGEGRGVLAWKYDGEDGYVDRDGHPLTSEQLTDELLGLARTESYIVQPKLENHPSIVDLSLWGLCTARIVTSRLPESKPVLVLAAFKMPGGKEVVDNFSYMGVACGIDPATGKLTGPATRKHPASELYTNHPDTGSRIDGRQLPDWDQAVAACLKAHEELADYPCIGWDVGLTPDGPAVIEGNVPMGFELSEIPTNIPLGSGPLGEAILGYAAKDL